MTPFKNTSATQPKSRNPLLWPFASDSIWNAPIGSKATYVDAKIQPARFITVDTDHFFALTDADPSQDVYNIGGWTNRTNGTRDLGFDLPIPDGLLLPDTNDSETPNNSAALLMPDGETLMQFNAMTRDRVGDNVHGVKYPFGNTPNETLTGSGTLGGHGGSALSSIGGTLRLGELTGDEPIRHALKLNLWAKKYLSYDDGLMGGKGYRWPAIKADSYANATSYGGPVSELVMGSLLAIPPNATPESLGLKTKPAKKIFYAMQDYGAYVADDTAWDSHALEAENGVLQEFEHEYGYDFQGSNGAFYDDIMSLFSALHVVDNNAPGAIGGGGTPRAPLAPDIDPGYVSDLQDLLSDPTVDDSFNADFNGDGKTDMLWRNLATGSNHVWLQDDNGNQVGGGNILPLTDPDWQIKATPDTDGDGDADIVWKHRATGAEQIWHLDDLRMWVDPSTGRHVNRWMENASGSPRIEFSKAGSAQLPTTDVGQAPQPAPPQPSRPEPAADQQPDASPPLTDISQPPEPFNGKGNGLAVTYFDNQDLTHPKVARTDAAIDFQWGETGSPDRSIAPDTFSARWTGQIQPRYSETYEFTTRSDDGVRLWVKGKLIIDDWAMQAPTENTGKIQLEAGQKYDIKVEYFDNEQGASMQLFWASENQSKEIVPEAQLYSSAPDPITPPPTLAPPPPSVPTPTPLPAPPPPSTLPEPKSDGLDLDGLDLSDVQSYAPEKQDKPHKSTVNVSDDGKAIRLQGNTWKFLPINYDVTPDTHISLEFRSNAEGDIQGIGFDTDQQFEGRQKRRSFKLTGTQSWGNRDFDDYVTQSGWKQYTIPVGEYLTGDMENLLFINDHDVRKPNGMSQFRNIELFEASDGIADQGIPGSDNSLLPNQALPNSDALLVSTS